MCMRKSFGIKGKSITVVFKMASLSVYCICGEPYDSVRFMIQCDSCKDWYHGSCVNVKEHESLDIEKYHCVQCQSVAGPSVYREVKNFHRHDYGDCDAEGKAVQSGTPVFLQELRSRQFLSGEEVILRLRGPSLNLPYLLQNGFNIPILVDSKVGLGLQMPSDTFTVSDVMDYVGPDYPLDVIDVSRQDNIRMCMKEFVEYFNNPVRNKVYNVISLEFTKTRLSELVKPPTIVQKLSWVENYWPKSLPDSFPLSKPAVMKYCLMSAQDSYTDFHIDFGGTSVWYHILRGEKVFYLIRPTPENMALYERWNSSPNHSESFFGDQVDSCYQLVLTQGQTLFIPTGWIHAVMTPVDSLVFGGNFLHTMNIPLQLQVYEMERRSNTPERFKFPSFETVHWFAAPHILDQLKDCNICKRELQHLIVGAKALVSVLKTWSSESQNHRHEDVPPGINVTKLIKDLQREVRIAEKFSSGKTVPPIAIKKPPPRLRKRKDINSNGTDSKQSSGGKEENVTLKFSLTPNLMSGYLSEKPPTHSLIPGRIPSNPARIPQVITQVPMLSNQSQHLDINHHERLPQKYELPPSLPPHLYNPLNLKSGMLADRNDMYKFQIPESNDGCKDELSSPSVKNESIYDFVDSDDDNLVVDENPPKQKNRVLDLTKHSRVGETSVESKPNSIKLRFSFNGRAVEDGLPMLKQPLVQPTLDDNGSEQPKNATIDDLLMATGLAVDAENSLDDDEDDLSGGRTSPSTREAIQGMLSISKSAFLFANQSEPNHTAPQPFTVSPATIPTTAEGQFSLAESSIANFSILAKKSSPQSPPAAYDLSKRGQKRPRYNNDDDDDDDFEESLKQCHQDSDYIYLGLEASDDEFHVFKPRGKSRRDEPWNPKGKAKLVPNCPKPERPVREGVRKEAIESGLAAAAAKLATMPPPKRQYLRKKAPSKNKESVTHQQPGPSWGSKRPLPTDALKANRKPKKGFATPKQRLGKILKIHKMLY